MEALKTLEDIEDENKVVLCKKELYAPKFEVKFYKFITN